MAENPFQFDSKNATLTRWIQENLHTLMKISHALYATKKLFLLLQVVVIIVLFACRLFTLTLTLGTGLAPVRGLWTLCLIVLVAKKALCLSTNVVIVA